jgi:hypothetical protein
MLAIAFQDVGSTVVLVGKAEAAPDTLQAIQNGGTKFMAERYLPDCWITPVARSGDYLIRYWDEPHLSLSRQWDERTYTHPRLSFLRFRRRWLCVLDRLRS